MNEKETKKEKNKHEKNESELVTKESLCAVGALFSVLAFIMLCTRTLIFGELGYAVFTFLTGVFGYLAYPLLLGVFYLCVTSLFEKRFIKNRKVVLCGVLCLLGIAFIVQTAVSWSSVDNGDYAKNCYYAAETPFGATLMGWAGGILISLCAAVTSKIGAIILFSALTLLCGYLTYLSFQNPQNKEKPAKKVSAKREKTAQSFKPIEIQAYDVAQQPQEVQSVVQPPVTQAPVGQAPTIQPSQTFVGQTPAYVQNATPAANVNVYQDSAFGVQPQQRPLVSLQDTQQEKETYANTNGGFSPFGTPQSVRQDVPGENVTDSRAFLFGASPAENYQKNLIFDPNARVNRRPSLEPSEQPILQSGYTPSYTEDYQKSVNDSVETQMPRKIVQDQVDEFETREYNQPTADNPYGLNIPRMQPVDEPPILPQEPVSYPDYSNRDNIMQEDVAYDEAPEEFTQNRGETSAREAGWNEYKDLFSPENPNVFGNGRENQELAEDTFSRGRTDRTESMEEDFARGRNESNDVLDDIFGRSRMQEDTVENDRDGGRLGRDFFDEPTESEDPYALKDDFSDRRTNAFETASDRGQSRIEEEISPVRETKSTPTESKQEMKSEAPPPPKPRVIRPYVRVPLDDFDCRDIEPTANFEEIEETKENIIATLEEFNVNGATIASVTNGPTVTRYNVTLPRSIPPKKVVALDQSIALSLHSSGINIYPNYEDGVVSIEVPNKERQFVQLGCMLAGDTFVNSKPSSLMFAMGKDVGNRKVYGDISKMIHLLVAGSSGSGKSVFLGSLIVSMIYKYSPEELRLILIDPKKTEFVLYNNLPHLMINEIITDVNKAVQSLNWAIGEMNRRYGLFELMSRAGTYVVNLDDYNANVAKKEDKLPKIVIIIDELADLMLAAKKEIEDRIQNLTQKARAAGIHLIVATQRPSTDVITGVIKSNLSTRIAFAVATDVDSRVILDQSGAQNLLGKGDFLYTMQGINTPVRVQSAFISPSDSQRVVNFIKSNNEAYYDEAATAFINNSKGESGGDGFGGGNEEVEGVYIEALRYVILSGSASISMIQRKCGVGYNKAGKIVEWMEDMGYISSFDGAKARKVLITKEEFESKYGAI